MGVSLRDGGRGRERERDAPAVWRLVNTTRIGVVLLHAERALATHTWLHVHYLGVNHPVFCAGLEVSPFDPKALHGEVCLHLLVAVVPVGVVVEGSESERG